MAVRRPVSLTRCSQLCDLPAASLNDQLPQHTFRVIWTASDAQKECVLFKGEAAQSSTQFLGLLAPLLTLSPFP